MAANWLFTARALCIPLGGSSGYFHRNPSLRDTISSFHFTEEEIEAQRGQVEWWAEGHKTSEREARAGPLSSARALELYSQPSCLSSGLLASSLPPLTPSPRGPVESPGPSLGSTRGRAVMWDWPRRGRLGSAIPSWESSQ